MSKTLVIVESAGKIKKISEYLGSDYIVKASLGHCMDLDPNNLSIDVEDNYKPNYIICEGKHKLVNELKKVANECDSVILATDNDREGEAIAYFLSNVLKLSNPPRIIFTEITKKALTTAIQNPLKINMDMVHAQQTRRLLDRLLGYKISPILQKNLNDRDAKSAGRVQSVVVKIINDKEIEINNALSTAYLKTTSELEFEKNKLKCNLMIFNDLYKNEFDLQLINKKTIFKVIDIQNKLSIRKPSPPFITSTLQQEASTKLKFNVKKTMDVAQKLYEGGYITYMRTDSPNLSIDAINSCKKYIIDTYGTTYSNPINYKSSGNAQEAHEAIRPTNINTNNLDISDKDQVKLYHLIWKKTVASQMAPAKINIQSIYIDTLNDNKSIFIDQFKDCIWLSTYSNIIFDGFLILDNDKDDDNDSEEQSGSLPIEINNILKFYKLTITEEYTKLPLRFNEANLVKYLEKNNIGRPSTYASIINKIIERNYVEIKDIDGIKKQVKIIELNKKLNINEIHKDIIIGKENKKIIPTLLGIKITEFLQNNFNDIMQIDFTSDFETYLDKISEGKATWYNVLDKFYKKFNSIVMELNKNNNLIKSSDKSIGYDTDNREIFIGSGKYGPYIKIMEDDKPKYFSIDSEDITLEEAIERIRFPKTLGKINKKHITLNKGQYGYYLKYDNQNYSATETTTLDDAIEIIKQKKESQKVFTIRNKKIYVYNGKFGPYLHIVNGDGDTKNIPLPKNTDIKNIEYKNILEIISKKNI